MRANHAPLIAFHSKKLCTGTMQRLCLYALRNVDGAARLRSASRRAAAPGMPGISFRVVSTLVDRLWRELRI